MWPCMCKQDVFFASTERTSLVPGLQEASAVTAFTRHALELVVGEPGSETAITSAEA